MIISRKWYRIIRYYFDIPRWNNFRKILGPSHRPLKEKIKIIINIFFQSLGRKIFWKDISLSHIIKLTYFSICQYISGNKCAFTLYMVHLGTPWLIGKVSNGSGFLSNSAIIHCAGLNKNEKIINPLFILVNKWIFPLNENISNCNIPNN